MTETSSIRPTGSSRRRGVAGMLAVTVMAALAFSLGVAPPREAGAQAPPTAAMFVAGHSGKALDVPGADHTPGIRLFQWTAHGGDNQLFDPVSFYNNGEINLVILQSVETGHVVDVAGGSTAPGTDVVQTQWAGSPSQVWWAAPFGDTGYTLFVNMGSGQVLEVDSASQANGARIIQWPWHGGANQLWQAAGVTH